jgi:hypothetical protein
LGKSPEKLRLTILVDEGWVNHPKMLELKEKGHEVWALESCNEGTTAHLILSKNAHMWDDKMWDLLDLPLKAARARKKGLAET